MSVTSFMCVVFPVVLSEGSVVVHFDVLFRGVLDSETAQEQLVDGLQRGEGGNDGLVIDIGSVQVSGNIINIKTYLQFHSHLKISI